MNSGQFTAHCLLFVSCHLVNQLAMVKMPAIPQNTHPIPTLPFAYKNVPHPNKAMVTSPLLRLDTLRSSRSRRRVVPASCTVFTCNSPSLCRLNQSPSLGGECQQRLYFLPNIFHREWIEGLILQYRTGKFIQLPPRVNVGVELGR